MEKIISLLLLLASAFSAAAQDTIVMKNSGIQTGKVTKIGGNYIEYKRTGNIDGPVYTVLRNQIAGIKYSQGEPDIFDAQNYNDYFKNRKPQNNNNPVTEDTPKQENKQSATFSNENEKSNSSLQKKNETEKPDNNQKTENKTYPSTKTNSVNTVMYDTLYNKTIIQLTKMGLPSQTIISKIQTSYASFDVSINGLMNLQSNGVSGEVINEMIKRNDQMNTQVSQEVNSNNPNVKHRSGIYYYNPDNENNKLKRVDPTVISTNKSGGFGDALARSVTYGIAQSSYKSSITGKKSRLQINSVNPEFYFYFEINSNPGTDSWFFATATSPNEFVCVKLMEKKDSREVTVGSANAYGSSMGISNRVKIDFDYEEVSEGIYKVTFKKPILKGEYCFLYASSTPTRYSNDKVFDFGILNAQ